MLVNATYLTLSFVLVALDILLLIKITKPAIRIGTIIGISGTGIYLLIYGLLGIVQDPSINFANWGMSILKMTLAIHIVATLLALITWRVK
ncbi:MAG: hypothetical protein A2445_05075 [Candidatus Jacksonbacteria bacterium RIFOXYC2_FULL_44_29]|nr:MAG: hypothetical protein UV19_C0002G0059 [Parcubacteria group bacterium GW2011_GWA2_42_28]KKT51561.1 MAG: hypothetical protein UW45_C0062G0005 [Parcubacteria group bacterium GW2011_GWC2_44_22]OGY74538.1 MAG: hypothetical protein A2240_03045 [Candidatus Jacksonbacteria bacterium RIFOXYA2_FULL_43_12]OGY77450.1 MAG: hypothetical protein A2295_01995 [Candidatus Jacksonbacteria bacterium RIFOXYB2_FULL_44_15]OGY77537.1 MAG: hypothetical protein A2445_05075 [Candidatus Jacksonbacteria bacterium RI